MHSLAVDDWAQVLSAAFAAIAAMAACASVYRVERDRWRRTLPDLHVEVVADTANLQMRLVIINNGGPAREVRVMGTIGDYGFFGNTPPTTYWRPGESRTFQLAMPPMDQVAHVFVEGRDLAKKQLVIGTVGGATFRWPLRKAKKLSAAKEWQRLFPGQPAPLEVPKTAVAITLLERSS